MKKAFYNLLKNIESSIYNKKIYIKNGFISLYALLLTLSISLVALHSLRTLAIKKDITLSLYFQKQSSLYAKSLHDIAIKCYTNFGFDKCSKDMVKFDDYFSGEYILNKDTIHDKTHNDYNKNVLILDISIYSKTPLSTHPLRYAKRYILKGVK